MDEPPFPSRFDEAGESPPQVHSTAVVGPGCRLGQGVKIGPYCVVSGEAEIGAGSVLANGVTIEAPASGPMLGKSVCFTGVRSPEMETLIESQGGTVKSSVGKNLTYLVAKDPKSTSGKAKKARDYGCEVVGVDEMWTRLGGRP